MPFRTNIASLGSLAIAMFAATPAFAAGTTAGAQIDNQASLTYSVGGVPQAAVTSNIASFLVDRRVTMTLTEPGNATTSVSPGSSGQVTTFLLTNTSNAVLDFGLALAQPVGGVAAHGGTDNFDVTAPIFRINTGASAGSATYDPVNSTTVTYIDELAADTSRYVFVLGNVPAPLANGSVAGVTLTAQARVSGTAGTQGVVLAETAGANTAGIDTVFADAAGATDALRDGQISARDDYTVAAPVLTILKTSTVISDPSNGTTNPKLIPGATVEYCIQVTNAAGGATAQAPAISDNVPTNTTFVASSIFLNATVTGGVCNADGTAGGTFTAGPPANVSGTLTDVAAGTTRALRFRVTIN